MVIILHTKGISEDFSISAIFLILALISGYFFSVLLGAIEPNKN
jgi:hypothetical protein